MKKMKIRYKYPNNIENTTDRGFTLCAIALDISIFLGRQSVVKKRDRDSVSQTLKTLVSRFERLKEAHKNKPYTKGW